MPQESVIFCIGTNHKHASVDLREILYIDAADIERHLSTLKQEFHFNELMILSTCNRLEMTGVVERKRFIKSKLLEAFHRLQKLVGHDLIDRIPGYENHLYILRDEEACHHTLRVASSLDSLVVGETQITGQFKDALQLAKTSGDIGSFLDRLGQDALSVAKKVRNQTDIGKKTVSIASAAAELVKTVFDQIENHRVLIVGAGEMARIVAKHLLSHNPRKFAIANRSEERAIKLINEIGAGDFIPIANLKSAIQHYDIIITATNAHEYILSKNDLKESLKNSTIKLCVDISLPRNIDPKCSEIVDLFVFDIDDLKQIVDSNMQARSAAAEEAEQLAQASAARYMLWFRRQRITPVLKETADFFDRIVSEEFDKTMNRIQNSSSNASAEDLAGLQKAVIKRLASSISKNLKEVEDSLELDFGLISALFRNDRSGEDD